MNIYVWADGTWAWQDERGCSFKRDKYDDYATADMPEWASDDDAEHIATAFCAGITPLAAVISSYFGLENAS